MIFLKVWLAIDKIPISQKRFLKKNIVSYFCGTKSGNKTAFPCNGCLCPNKSLDKVTEYFQLRTIPHMSHAIDRALNEGNLSITKKLSLRGDQNPIYKWCNPHIQRGPDMLHQFHLGEVKSFLDALQKVLTKEQLNLIDEKIASVRISGLKVDTKKRMKRNRPKIPFSAFAFSFPSTFTKGFSI